MLVRRIARRMLVVHRVGRCAMPLMGGFAFFVLVVLVTLVRGVLPASVEQQPGSDESDKKKLFHFDENLMMIK